MSLFRRRAILLLSCVRVSVSVCVCVCALYKGVREHMASYPDRDVVVALAVLVCARFGPDQAESKNKNKIIRASERSRVDRQGRRPFVLMRVS